MGGEHPQSCLVGPAGDASRARRDLGRLACLNDGGLYARAGTLFGGAGGTSGGREPSGGRGPQLAGGTGGASERQCLGAASSSGRGSWEPAQQGLRLPATVAASPGPRGPRWFRRPESGLWARHGADDRRRHRQGGATASGRLGPDSEDLCSHTLQAARSAWSSHDFMGGAVQAAGAGERHPYGERLSRQACRLPRGGRSVLAARGPLRHAASPRPLRGRGYAAVLNLLSLLGLAALGSMQPGIVPPDRVPPALVARLPHRLGAVVYLASALGRCSDELAGASAQRGTLELGQAGLTAGRCTRPPLIPAACSVTSRSGKQQLQRPLC